MRDIDKIYAAAIELPVADIADVGQRLWTARELDPERLARIRREPFLPLSAESTCIYCDRAYTDHPRDSDGFESLRVLCDGMRALLPEERS